MVLSFLACCSLWYSDLPSALPSFRRPIVETEVALVAAFAGLPSLLLAATARLGALGMEVRFVRVVREVVELGGDPTLKAPPRRSWS